MSIRSALIGLIGLILPTAGGVANAADLGVELKLQAIQSQALRGQLLGQDSSTRLEASSRLKADAGSGAFQFQLHYLAFAEYQDLPRAAFMSPAPARPPLDLGSDIHAEKYSGSGHRIDRAWLSWSSRSLVLKAGRGALSWGNGTYFQVLDLFNPFSFDAKDSSYKPGIDMVFGQYLLDSGADFQLLIVPRSAVGERGIDERSSSAALRYYGFAGDLQFELLAASDYQDEVAGLGLAVPVRGAIWKTDIQHNRTREGRSRTSLVSNVQYAWSWAQRPYSGTVEYYRNAFGHADERSLAEMSPALIKRAARSQLFTTGRDYLAASLAAPLTELLNGSVAVLSNLHDGSGLGIVGMHLNAGDSSNLIFGLQLPFGSQGSDFGGRALTPQRQQHVPAVGQFYARYEHYF